MATVKGGVVMQQEMPMAERSSDRDALANEIPALRRYAQSLVGGSVDRADDLVQECLLRALTRMDRFRPGSNLRAWLITILRNLYIDEQRRQVRQTAALASVGNMRLSIAAPNQEASVALGELRERLDRMPARDKEVLGIMGVDGYTTEEAASRLRLPPGTVKSRLSRARRRLPDIHVAAG